jgi:hypothetical protein
MDGGLISPPWKCFHSSIANRQVLELSKGQQTTQFDVSVPYVLSSSFPPLAFLLFPHNMIGVMLKLNSF